MRCRRLVQGHFSCIFCCSVWISSSRCITIYRYQRQYWRSEFVARKLIQLRVWTVKRIRSESYHARLSPPCKATMTTPTLERTFHCLRAWWWVTRKLPEKSSRTMGRVKYMPTVDAGSYIHTMATKAVRLACSSRSERSYMIISKTAGGFLWQMQFKRSRKTTDIARLKSHGSCSFCVFPRKPAWDFLADPDTCRAQWPPILLWRPFLRKVHTMPTH